MAKWTLEMCGKLADFQGRIVTLDLAVEECSIAMLCDALGKAYPELADIYENAKIKICVESEITDKNSTVSFGQSIAFFPPLSGG